MPQEDAFAAWAALFIDSLDAGTAAVAAAPPQEDGLTPDARDLLRSVDAGGVPAFVTANLLRIAQENGIEVATHWTPNEIVDAIRTRARTAAATAASGPPSAGRGDPDGTA